MPDPDRITIARLDGTATRHVVDQTDRATAVADLVELATERRKGRPARLRVDLLSESAGGLLGYHRAQPEVAWSAPAAVALLMAAGADPDLVAQHAKEAADHLRVASRPGIGHRV